MSKIIGKISRIPKTLYEHKKKTIFISFLGYLGADWVYRWDKNQGIRKHYANIAVKYGQKTVSPEDRPKRIFVLVNVEGNSRSCFDAFNKNALPLFLLSGVQVDVVKADNEAQLEALAGAVDTQEADVLYVVGGDGTIGKVVTGIFRNREKAQLPVGFYPGGYDNLWLKRMIPTVFEKSEDVRNACESAMAVIEDQKQSVFAFELTTENSEVAPEYGLGDVSAGWFRQIEDTRKKFWYFSVIKRRWAYVWEMLKRSPRPIECHVEYEETCSGCEKCRPKPIIQAPTWRWWHVLTGTPKYKNNDAQKDYTGIINVKCGEKHEIDANGAELLIENEQMSDYSQLRFRMGGNDIGRFGVVSDGFKRCSENIVGRSTDEKFYNTDFLANAVSFKITSLPSYIHRLYISSNPTPKDAELTDRTITIRGTQKKLDVFFPTSIRLELFMTEVEFEWNESKLQALSHILPKWASGNVENPIELESIQLQAEIRWLTNRSDTVGVKQEFKRLLNTSFDPLMDYEEHQKVKEEISSGKNSFNWISDWYKIAEKLSISHIDKNTNTVTFRRLQILPNVLPILVIAHTTPQNVIIIYGKRQSFKEEIDLQTILRHSYSNIPDGSLQTIHFLSKNLLDLYSQLFSRQIAPEFKTKHFRCLPSLWLQYNVVGPILDKIEGDHQSKITVIPLDEATANWVKRKWTNYEYLTYLNEITGRVRGEVHNHPIFPWVCDFTSENSGFRQLNRTKYRLCKGDDQLREMYSREPSHHVPELLSDIGYMVYRARVESKEKLCRHVRRKWVPEEYPSTMSRMFQWTPDECIPEFFDDPSIFKSCHPDMSDLRYPEFVSSPEEFIIWHRKMLEDEEVSMNLHRWIDLVFGFNLSIEDSKNSLNLHLCFVEKNRRGLRTNGMVQLFNRPHPSRIPLNYNPKSDSYHLQMESFGYGMKEDIQEKTIDDVEESVDEDSHYQMFQKIKKVRRLRHKTYFSSMISLMEMMAQIVLAPHLVGRFDDPDHIRRCVRLFAYRIPVNYRKLFDFLLNLNQDFPDCDEFAFFVSVRLNIPTTISNFSEEFSKCVSLHLLRKLDVIPPFSKRSQLLLIKEVESLKKSIRLCDHMELCVVAAFQQLLEDEEACIQAVHRLMPVITRSLSQSALEDLINPMIELIQCETSVKLLDRRFLMHVSICYGTHTFLDLFLPPIVEACASMNCDRSVVAKESIMWLAKRYGPVICAKFISSNLLRIMASCYEGFELVGFDEEPKSVFGVILQGDETCSRIESLLSEIVLTYSVTFITVQFLPFCVDLIEQFHKRPSVQLEPGLVSVFRIVELSIRSMSDHQLMNYLEEFIIQKVIYRVLTILLDVSFQFSSVRVRNIVICKVCQLLHSITQKIGTENSRIYASQPFKLIFSTFSAIYETNEELRINVRRRSPENTLFEVPLWMVEDVVDKFAKEWGVPFLSSFCDDPAFLIPFISNTVSSSPNITSQMAHSPPSSFTAYSLGNMSSGNRLFSLSASSPVSSANSLGGLSLCDSGSLSAVWCARVSAAVCGVDNYRFDHLSLCNFTGHQERIRKLAAISNENSFVSASSDKTVKLWSIKPEQDEIGCQWTYPNHTRSVHDVTILADNSIASTDGVLHVWDPFRTTLLAQLEWDSKEGNGGNIMRIENVDRHILSAICSLHSTVKLFDSRVGGWTCELKVSPGPGLTRAITVRDNGNKMAVALSNGTLAILDARNGKINALAQTNSTHTVSVNWLSDSRLLVCDADECGVFLETIPRAHIVRKLQDPVSAAVLTDNSLVTLQTGSMLRVYRNSGELQIETKIRPDELPGTPTAVLPLPLNCSYLIGSSHGAIRLMC